VSWSNGRGPRAVSGGVLGSMAGHREGVKGGIEGDLVDDGRANGGRGGRRVRRDDPFAWSNWACRSRAGGTRADEMVTMLVTRRGLRGEGRVGRRADWLAGEEVVRTE